MIGFIIFAALLSIPTIIDVHHAGIAEELVMSYYGMIRFFFLCCFLVFSQPVLAGKNSSKFLLGSQSTEIYGDNIIDSRNHLIRSGGGPSEGLDEDDEYISCRKGIGKVKKFYHSGEFSKAIEWLKKIERNECISSLKLKIRKEYYEWRYRSFENLGWHYFSEERYTDLTLELV